MEEKKKKKAKKKRASKYEKKFVIHGTMEDVLKASILHADKK
jgi:hypothetical protein